MEFLAMLYTVLLVAICLMMALLLFRSGRPTGGLDEADCEELKDWLEEQLAAQAREFNARQDAIAQQNYAAIRSVSETLQTAVQSMSTTLGQGQDSQQRILERRLQSLEQANNQQMEQLRRAMVESMTALQAENTRKLDEIRHTVDEQLQDALQKRVTESFKAVNQQLEQVYKGLGEMQSLAADVGGLKQVLSGVKTRGILGEIQLGAILAVVVMYFKKLWPFCVDNGRDSGLAKHVRWPVMRLWFKIIVACLPAAVLGLADRKGMLEPGYDADFVLVDLDTPYTVDKNKLHSKSHNCPFDGAQLYGRVCATVKGGELTYQAEE